jgi:glycosyltransferase involved in cell wall biosynthesis
MGALEGGAASGLSQARLTSVTNVTGPTIPGGQQRPRFSVVVPAYNEGAYLGRTLASLQEQDFAGSYEVIVVDNNSDDDTGEVARSFGVRLVLEPETGVCAARQRGAEAAAGEILVSTDADTEQPRDWLCRIDATFRDRPGAVAVAGPCRYEGERGWSKAYPALLFGLVARLYAWTGLVVYVSATNVAMRRTAFPGYDRTQTQGGDELDLLRRLRRVGPVVWDPRNVVTTSARRLERGFLYNFFVTFLTYYLLGYAVNRLARRRRFGMAPAVRAQHAEGVHRRRPVQLVGVVVLAVAASVSLAWTGVAVPDPLHGFWSARH